MQPKAMMLCSSISSGGPLIFSTRTRRLRIELTSITAHETYYHVRRVADQIGPASYTYRTCSNEVSGEMKLEEAVSS